MQSRAGSSVRRAGRHWGTAREVRVIPAYAGARREWAEIVVSENQPDNDCSFPSTQWSLVDRAAAGDTVARRRALGDLLTRYLPALRAHLVLKKRIDRERADDLLQGFITNKVLEQGLIARADPDKERFRALLATSLNHYVIDVYRHQSGTPPAFSLSETERTPPIGDSDSPSHVFDVAWARERSEERRVGKE